MHESVCGASPRDDVGGEAQHERADEGADFSGCSLPSPSLLLQASLPDTETPEHRHVSVDYRVSVRVRPGLTLI